MFLRYYPEIKKVDKKKILTATSDVDITSMKDNVAKTAKFDKFRKAFNSIDDNVTRSKSKTFGSLTYRFLQALNLVKPSEKPKTMNAELA